MSMMSCCPFCSQQVLSIDLQRHANSHFEDQDDDQQHHHVQLVDHIQSQTLPCSPQPSSTNLMSLLKNCLDTEPAATTSFLSGHVDHFHSIDFEDVGWGCGWRNIQMLTSHLLFQRPEAKPLLFGGSGFVPDIPSLQTWLEVAWNKGFDAPGANHFNRKISGKRAWIGTTECAALFRSFGLRACIVDFTTSSTGTSSSKSTPKLVGPMDRYLNRPHHDASSSNSNNNKCVGEIVKGHQLLFNWVRSYFSDSNMTTKSGVIVTQKAPLYFQHDGHSRTIVGIQLKRLPNGTDQHNLLILDPAHVSTYMSFSFQKVLVPVYAIWVISYAMGSLSA
ncbi:peptidase C78, ubiquitin fold modifier-specific peptidase 1/ 2 [Artemisia annua]|uniref:Peptidase C78, ubiquitin fold modifier-specific peptidase 1/ 2 n=1 Tax=Artemisia annua TaxID=35608 RepID=A0A2U1NAL0_ARTAN|nr:peptidase C78, ubiquitin fold modifier-specific peptidase 1/ 2 [Artemisia annua]